MRFRLLLGLLVLLFALPALANPDFEWLDVRRKGADAMADLARQRTASSLKSTQTGKSAQTGWTRTFKADVGANHPLAGTRVQVARAYVNGQTQLLFRVLAGPPGLAGTGVVLNGTKGWLRTPGEKVKPMPQETLFRPLPILNVPPIVFCALEWKDAYGPAVEGEFDQVAVLRLTPRYELGVGARPAKASISKVYGELIALSVNDGKGAQLAELAWAWANKGGPPTEFNLKGPGENATPVRFASEGPPLPATKGLFSPTALK